MNATKGELRKAIKEAKKALTTEEKSEAARRCFANVEQCGEFAAAQRVLVYNSLPDEISTAAFIEKWHERKQLFLPRVNGDELDILAFEPGQTEEGAFHIMEPTGDDCIDPMTLDLIIVPGVGFDRHGNRLGRGKGFYDRLLHNCRCPKIGVAYACQLQEAIPAEPHDVRMDAVVTDREILRFSTK